MNYWTNTLKRVLLNSNFKFLFIVSLVVFNLSDCPVCSAQTVDSSVQSAQTTDTAYSNKTMKSVFKELKHITKTGNSTLTSILMILAVILVVAVAMYLSFKTDTAEED